MISGGSVGIKVNDKIGPYFQTKRGLRQGDPMSPILFNIVVDMLALIIKRAKDDGQIRGVIPNLLDDGLSILQYADDTSFSLIMTWNKLKILNYCFVLSNSYLG